MQRPPRGDVQRYVAAAAAAAARALRADSSRTVTGDAAPKSVATVTSPVPRPFSGSCQSAAPVAGSSEKSSPAQVANSPSESRTTLTNDAELLYLAANSVRHTSTPVLRSKA